MTTNNRYSHVSRQASDFRYFDLARHWSGKLRGVFESAVVQTQLFNDFTKFQKDKERRYNQSLIDRGLPGTATFSFLPTDKPMQCDSLDWRLDRVGRPFAFDEYVCARACHWIVNSLLMTARIAYPNKPWIIVSSHHHSTVWDQDVTFFDMNYFALKISAEDCASQTILDPTSIFFTEGVLMELI